MCRKESYLIKAVAIVVCIYNTFLTSARIITDVLKTFLYIKILTCNWTSEI